MRALGVDPPISQPWHLESRATVRVANKDLIMIAPRFQRDSFYAVDPSRRTIVTLGDSFTEGYPVTRDYAYPTAMQRLLFKQGCDVNLINMGLGNSGPDQHLRLMRKFLLPRLKPDAVVWQFYENDIGDNIRQALYDIQREALVPLDGNHWMYWRQKLYDFIPLPASVKESSPIVRLLLMGLEVVGDRRLPEGSNSDRSAWSLNKIRLAIKEMDHLAKLHGFAVYYVLVASQTSYLAGTDHPDVAGDYDLLRELLRERSEFVSAWFGDVHAQPRDLAFEIPPSTVAKPNIFADDRRDSSRFGNRHFNEIGYQLLAEVVADRLAEDCQSWGVAGR